MNGRKGDRLPLSGLLIVLLWAGLLAAGPEPASRSTESSRVKVFYFHGKFRCPTCLKIEQLSARAVREAFPDELKRGSLEWRVVDVDRPENRHFDQEFALESSTLAIARYDGDKLRKYVKLEKVWELVDGDEVLFTSYVRDEVRQFVEDLPDGLPMDK